MKHSTIKVIRIIVAFNSIDAVFQMIKSTLQSFQFIKLSFLIMFKILLES